MSNERPGRELDRRAVMSSLATAGLLGACGETAAQTPNGVSLQILSPRVQGRATVNLKRPGGRPPGSFTYAMSDADAQVRAARIPFHALAPGMRNVEVFLHGRPVARFSPGPGGEVRGELDLRAEAKGPLVLEVSAWDSPAGDHRFDIVLKMRVILFVTDGRDASPPALRPPGHPAHGKALIFEDDFTQLSAGRADGAAAGLRWFTNKPGGGDFGDAAFEVKGSPRDPFTVADSFLRIRAQYDEAYVDPYGFKRHWYSGLLATAFPDASASFAAAKGYFEARMLIPHGAGTWPAFWLLTRRGITDAKAKTVELDVLEAYGFSDSYNVTTHLWNARPKRTAGDAITPAKIPGAIPDRPTRNDLTWEFHDFGVKVTDSHYVFYFDGTEVRRYPAYKTDPDEYFVLINLALGGGWPTPVPPGRRHDLWIDHVRVYAA